MAVANTVLYPIDYVTKFQERLDYDTNWKQVCKVDISNKRVLTNPYMSTVPSLQAHTRGTAYTHQTFALTTEAVTINQSQNLGLFIDRADLAQQTYVDMMDLADLEGQLINEYFETDMLANHGMWTDFDNSSIGGSAGNITVSANNIDDIIRGIKREIREANGSSLANKNGIFIIWRAADFEILEAYVQAQGYATADDALKNGTVEGFRYMGVSHYVSNLHTANHLFAGVKGLFHLGILQDTYGQVIYDQEPATADGPLSGIGIVSRMDWEYVAWNNLKVLLFDVAVA